VFLFFGTGLLYRSVCAGRLWLCCLLSGFPGEGICGYIRFEADRGCAACRACPFTTCFTPPLQANLHTYTFPQPNKKIKNHGHSGSFAESETRHTAGDADAADRHLSFYWTFDAQAPRKSCYYGVGACRAKEELAVLCGCGVEGKRRGCRASSCFLLPYEEGTTAHGCIILIIGHSFQLMSPRVVTPAG
jgi:hypothetical protein